MHVRHAHAHGAVPPHNLKLAYDQPVLIQASVWLLVPYCLPQEKESNDCLLQKTDV
jgi:hypothetical protein